MPRASALALFLYAASTAPLPATDSAVASTHMSNGDYAAAYREYRGLAEAGYPAYQSQIASMHAQGQGVSRDKVQAYAWYALSAAQGDRQATRAKIQLEQQLSQQQLTLSKTLARRYAAEYLAPYRPPGWSLD